MSYSESPKKVGYVSIHDAEGWIKRRGGKEFGAGPGKWRGESGGEKEESKIALAHSNFMRNTNI